MEKQLFGQARRPLQCRTPQPKPNRLVSNLLGDTNYNYLITKISSDLLTITLAPFGVKRYPSEAMLCFLSIKKMNTADKRRFGGISRLFGSEGFERLQKSHITVVGVGGVGSWVAEALARTAVGEITIIDGDTIEESNTNRQLPALEGNFGKKKVQVLAQRLQAINPDLKIHAVDEFLTTENFDRLIPSCDAVIDCIDSLSAKTFLVAEVAKRGFFVLTSGGAGGKVDVSRVSFTDVALAKGDTLIAAMRSKLRKEYGFPKVKAGDKPARFGIGAVFSDEPVRASQDGGEGFGVFASVTMTFAMRLVQECVKHVLEKNICGIK